MPVLNPLLKELDKKEILRYAGMRERDEAVEKELHGAVREALLYCRAQGVWQIYAYQEPLVMSGGAGYDPGSRNLCEHLHGAARAAVLAVTVGEEVERRIEELFRGGQYTGAVLLDAAATAATEQAADKVCEFIYDGAKKEGLSVTKRFSPGYGDWNIKQQPHVLELAHAQEIGLAMTKSFMLMPRKSVTAIMGLTPFTQENFSQNDCAGCDKQDCQLRRK